MASRESNPNRRKATSAEDYRNQIRRAFPMLDRVQNPELRRLTEEAYIYALTMSTWSNLTDIPWALLGSEPVGSFVDHVRIVAEIADQNADVLLRAGHELDPDIVVASALLHDVGKIIEYGLLDGRPVSNNLVRHSFSGAHIALAVGLPDEVVHVIAFHAWEGELELPGSSERPPARRLINVRTKEAIVVACADLVALKILRREQAEEQGTAPDLSVGVRVNPAPND